jgi:hypothetical protein
MMEPRHEQRRKSPRTNVEDNAMKIRAPLARYGFLVGALVFALVLSGAVAFSSLATGGAGVAPPPGWSADETAQEQVAQEEEPPPPATQSGEAEPGATMEAPDPEMQGPAAMSPASKQPSRPPT